MSNILETRAEPGGPRHYLEDRPVHAGDTLSLLLEHGRWVEGRYEWTFKEADPPMFMLALGELPERTREQLEAEEEQGIYRRPPLVELTLPPRAVLRWPGKR